MGNESNSATVNCNTVTRNCTMLEQAQMERAMEVREVDGGIKEKPLKRADGGNGEFKDLVVA